MNRRNVLTLGATALAGTGALWLAPRAGLAPLGAAHAQDAPEIRDMTMGAEDAPVTLIEYASLTCSHCATFHKEIIPRLKAEYIDTGKVRLVYREVYFRNDRPALWAAMVARCGGDMRYFGIIKMLYEKQREWLSGDTGQDIVRGLMRVGRAAGLSDEEMNTCLRDGDMAQAMVDLNAANLDEYDISGTPSVVINGTLHSNMPYAKLKDLIEAELAG